MDESINGKRESTKKVEKSKKFENIRNQIQSLFHLSDNEAIAYITLLSGDKMAASEVSRSTSIHRSRTYEIFRNLANKGLISQENGSPQQYRAISPRIAIDGWLVKRERQLEKENSELLSILPALQRIWNYRQEELLGKRLYLISEELVRDILPQEIRSAKQSLCLAIRDPLPDIQVFHEMATKLFNPSSLSKDIKTLMKHKVPLRILVGNSAIFIKKSSPSMLKDLLTGLTSDLIEVRGLEIPLPQSFLIVDDLRIYLFFLNPYQHSGSEAIRTETESLRDFLIIVWKMLWEKAKPVNVDTVYEAIEKSKHSRN